MVEGDIRINSNSTARQQTLTMSNSSSSSSSSSDMKDQRGERVSASDEKEHVAD